MKIGLTCCSFCIFQPCYRAVAGPSAALEPTASTEQIVGI